MNDYQKIFRHALTPTVSGKKLLLGWAFKKDTNDTRESAAIYVADDLINEEAQIAVLIRK
jgi:UDPglucose 6-dehydrogenase